MSDCRMPPYLRSLVWASVVKLEPRHSWRQLDQQRAERAVGLPQLERSRQPEPQPGLSLHEFRHRLGMSTDRVGLTEQMVVLSAITRGENEFAPGELVAIRRRLTRCFD